MRKRYGFKKWLRMWLFEENDNEVKLSSMTISRDEGLSGEPLRISVYSASGGMIVETRTYDRQKDRHSNSLYIVNDGEDLGNELGKIITMASISR